MNVDVKIEIDDNFLTSIDNYLSEEDKRTVFRELDKIGILAIARQAAMNAIVEQIELILVDIDDEKDFSD